MIVEVGCTQHMVAAPAYIKHSLQFVHSRIPILGMLHSIFPPNFMANASSLWSCLTDIVSSCAIQEVVASHEGHEKNKNSTYEVRKLKRSHGNSIGICFVQYALVIML